MPSAPRDSAPGLHHVWVNATSNWPYYRDDVDRLQWIRRLLRTLDRNDWRCIAFCQMTTHVHAIFDIPDGSLPRGMEYLNREYGKDFNARHGRVGSFVRHRYGSRRIADAPDLLGTYAYVVNNPVGEGLCPCAEDWRWSSFATTLGISRDFPFVDASLVLAELGSTTVSARAALRELVAAQAGRAVSARHVR